MNQCIEWSNINLVSTDRCADYDLIHSENDEESMVVVQYILDMWDLVNNRNCMKNPE